MMSPPPVFIADWSVANPLGADRAAVERNLLSAWRGGLRHQHRLNDGRLVRVGRLGFEPEALPEAFAAWDSANNRLVMHCLRPLLPCIEGLKARFGAARLGVVIGTSTSGIASTEEALSVRAKTGAWPATFRPERQELGDPSAFAAAVLGAQGPVFGVSTACTSGGKAMISAARLLQSGLCDAVVTGGVDTLCGLTLNGFSVLDSVSARRCNPFSVHRDGISLGEGGALFVLSREASALRLAGWGESADAHHLNAPDPEGRGATLAIETALQRAGLPPSAIGYINLHGTATRLNDAAEARVTNRLFGPDVAMSSTKGMTGHMLGAAASNEAAFTLMALTSGEAPAHLWDGEADPALAPIRLVDRPGERVDGQYMMSCSYAFGGNNAALILGRE